jgi:hypothetical protein
MRRRRRGWNASITGQFTPSSAVPLWSVTCKAPMSVGTAPQAMPCATPSGPRSRVLNAASRSTISLAGRRFEIP